MSKKDWTLLGYLAYKSAKNQPGKLENEIGKFILGWIFLMLLGLVIYIIFTIILDPPSFITSNVEIIKSLAIIIVMVIVIYFCYSVIIERLRKHNNKQDPIKHAKELQHERLGEKSNYKRRPKSKHIRCPECNSLVNITDDSKCRYCGHIVSYKTLSTEFPTKYTDTYTQNKLE